MAVAQVLPVPKLYLDTNHLIKLSKLRLGKLRDEDHREAYSFIDDCIRNRHFGLIFNPAATLEWVDGSATQLTAYEIADVVDSAPLQYELEQDGFVYLHEVLTELRRIDPQLRFPDYPILPVRDLNGSCERAVSVLMSEVPEYFQDLDLLPGASELPLKLPFYSARSCVDSAWNFKGRRPDTYDERVAGYEASLARDVNTFAARRSKEVTGDDKAAWMRRFLKIEMVIKKRNVIDDEGVENLLSRIDLDRCPAVKLYMKAREQRLAATQPKEGRYSHENDADDWMFLPVVPYADVVLTEKQFNHFLRSADPELKKRVTRSPVEAVEMLQRWI